MGQKINPISNRLGYTTTWRSRWFDLKNYPAYLVEDQKMRKLIYQQLRKASLSKIEIERFGQDAIVSIFAARPGMIIGHGGASIENLRKQIKSLIKRDVKINIIEIKDPEANAAVIANQIVEQIEKRLPFRRAVKGAMGAAQRSKIDGIKIIVAGRLNGAEIARTELFVNGKIPLHTFRHFIDYAQREAHTTYGVIGVKVWVFKAGEKDFEPDKKPTNQ
ncbi:TPA: 30S ribosomal protein S3 [Patescibacteria group bacterium]|uniref:Small ribosomal subunit protein uS3 n=2 Tax=root TaxID=1 RepID=A0A0G1KYE9_UNCK3|nr:30S ribosomal protein S3 [uncultured organism]KKT52929.1 MAG: 30S ribosomal protein S3 [candidate division Kazan bacterium GW2011_GWA1_44_22]HAR55025.1 30S ribosomal protein S3 [Patescibacteria group bacterium]HCR41915.1 30S ribosomal protein S3 [Patescibacteria group bacterium]